MRILLFLTSHTTGFAGRRREYIEVRSGQGLGARQAISERNAAAAAFEVETRLEYLQKKTQVKKIGVLHDPSPYANAQKAAAEKEAKDYGLIDRVIAEH